MKQIIAMGGGGFTQYNASLKLERYILEQCKAHKPKVCFLAQASAEDNDYTLKFFETFLKLGAEPSKISLFGRVQDSWKDHLLTQDLIYVGGGNTRTMLAIWHEWGMDKILHQAYEKGIVLSGLSAGAICWFEQAITDSVWPLGALNGLKLLKGSCCPHYDSEPERRPTFMAKVKNREVMPGIALEDGVAAHFVDGKLHNIFSENPDKKAYFVTESGEEALANTHVSKVLI